MEKNNYLNIREIEEIILWQILPNIINYFLLFLNILLLLKNR